MSVTAGNLVSIVLIVLAVLHFAWALGVGPGFGAALPEKDGKPLFAPHPIVTALVGALLLTAAAIVLGRVGWWGAALPTWIFRFGAWALAGVFVVRAVGDFRYCGFFKRVRGTRFADWDTRLFSPLCLALGVLLLGVARS